MALNKKSNFIVIDDSKLDCFIAEKVIKNTGLSEAITSFVNATEALEYISKFNNPEPVQTIVLVDIQMPVMNGFQFVEAFELLPDAVRSNFTLYIISSSINDKDLNRVNNYASVRQFLNKPLNSNTLCALLQK